jgi:hypothetical protein
MYLLQGQVSKEYFVFALKTGVADTSIAVTCPKPPI